MNKCKLCGGELKETGNGTYRCIYCMHEFTDDDFVSAGTPIVAKKPNSGVSVFDNNVNGILEITCVYSNCAACGSGLLINDLGYAITNTHVVTHNGIPCEQITVKIAGQKVGAKVVLLGDDRGGDGDGVDLALLKLDSVPTNAVSLTLADFNSVKNGEQVYVIGNSLGDGTCITSGIVSDRLRTLDGSTLLMTDCAINNGNSGGPIFNSNGAVIGVIVSSRIKRDGSATEGMNYAIPSFIVQEFINGQHTAVEVRPELLKGCFIQKAICPKCGKNVVSFGHYFLCRECGHKW